MMVTAESAVLILGAGSSAQFELPLGGPILELATRQVRNEFRAEQRFASVGHEPGGTEGFWLRPVMHTLQHTGSYRQDRFSELGRLLSNQTSETVDDFIVENPTFAPMTKLLVASILFRSCHEIEKNNCVVKNFAARVINHRRNWIHLFINVVRQGIRLKQVTPDNKVRVITFNYDTILEQVLDAQFSNTESQYGNWEQYIEIVHVHGHFPPSNQQERKRRILRKTFSFGPTESRLSMRQQLHNTCLSPANAHVFSHRTRAKFTRRASHSEPATANF